MTPHVLLYMTVTCSVLVLLEKYERVDTLGDDFRIRFCILGSTAVLFMRQRYHYSAVLLRFRHEGVLFQPEVLRMSTYSRYCADTARRILEGVKTSSTSKSSLWTTLC